jgi:DNA-nicking Smr family endonuclease
MTNHEKTGFMESIEGIRKLEQDRIDPQQDRPKKPPRVLPKNPVADKPSTSGIASTPESTLQSWFHHGLQKKLQRKIKQAQIPIDTTLDLHGYRQKEALHELESLLQYSLQHQARMLLIVHGKGYGSNKDPVLRPLVQHWLSEQPAVLAWCPAQAIHGGGGASYVYLKSQR